MTRAWLDRIVAAVLYEGYILYPYRPSVKNSRRWTPGGLYPEGGSDAWSNQTAVLVRGGPATAVSVTVRFLHLTNRLVGGPGLPFRPVESLRVGDRVLYTWQEAREREVALGEVVLGELMSCPSSRPFTFAGGRQEELVRDSSGKVAAVLVREQRAVEGVVEADAALVDPGLFRVRVRVVNRTPRPMEGDEPLLRALVSAHTVLDVRGGEFVSLLDPPADCRGAAAACRNVGTWPVLVGAEGERKTVLSSPIILYDYPRLAPESPGDFFDATEIDEMLTLRILTLTDDEKRAMAALDDRTAALLARTQSLAREQMLGLHGAVRLSDESDRRHLECVPVGGALVRAGDRVRLRPCGRADIFDLALAGMSATVEAIEQDFEGRIYLAVTVDDDPGRDLGRLRQPGHRFFFQPEEVEPLS